MLSTMCGRKQHFVTQGLWFHDDLERVRMWGYLKQVVATTKKGNNIPMLPTPSGGGDSGALQSSSSAYNRSADSDELVDHVNADMIASLLRRVIGRRETSQVAD